MTSALEASPPSGRTEAGKKSLALGPFVIRCPALGSWRVRPPSAHLHTTCRGKVRDEGKRTTRRFAGSSVESMVAFRLRWPGRGSYRRGDPDRYLGSLDGAVRRAKRLPPRHGRLFPAGERSGGHPRADRQADHQGRWLRSLPPAPRGTTAGRRRRGSPPL